MESGEACGQSIRGTVGGSSKASILSGREKPPVHPIEVDAIPVGLKCHHRWIGWNWTWNAQRGK